MKRTINLGASEVLQRLEGKVLELGQAQDVFLTIPEVAKLLHLSTSTLYKMSAKRSIPGACKPTGKRVYFSRSAIFAWLKSHQLKTSEELQQEAIDHVALRKAS